MTSSGPRSDLVLILLRPRQTSFSSNTPAKILVPPRSTPTK